jgi:hypothetical protein
MSTIITEEIGGAELLLDVLYNIGSVLVEDDLKDFPWDPMVGGLGHLRGGLHHGFLGYLLQQVAVLGQLANIGANVRDELYDKNEFQLLMERWEKIAYPEPTL